MQFWKTKAFTYLSGGWSFRWWALGVAWVACLVGWAVVAAVPDRYQVEAKIYLDTDTMMAPLLKGLTINVDPSERIAFMLRTLITRPNLEQVLRLTDPSATSLTPAALEQRVEVMAKRVSIRGLDAKNYYAIGFTDNSSDYAQAVTQTLLSILVDSNIGDKRRDMDSARTFIDQKLSEYESRLRESERRRADFKTANLDILGKAAAPNRLDQVSSELDQAKKDLSTAVAKRNTLSSQLETTPKTVAMDEALLISSITGRAMGGDNPANNANATAAQRLQLAKRALDDMRLRYTDNHPDVISLKKVITDLEAQVAGKPEGDTSNGDSGGVPNPVYVQLRTMLAQEEMNVSVERQRVATASSELADAKNVTTKAIDILTKYADLDRDYGNIERTYQELLKSREAANLSQAMDDQSQAITFRVIEAPQKAQFPTAPNRLLWNSFVLLMGLAAGVGAAVLLSLNSGRFLASEDLAAEFGVPIIGVVTRLRQAVDIRRQRTGAIALSASLALLLFCYVGVLIVLRTSVYSVFGA
jgi:protein tyrosine kinase modulator